MKSEAISVKSKKYSSRILYQSINLSVTRIRKHILFVLLFALLSVLLLVPVESFAQTPSAKNTETGHNKLGDDPFYWEIKPTDVNEEFVSEWNYNPAHRSSQSLENTAPQIRFVYLVPSDKPVRDDYKAAIADAALHLQDFYQKELGNNNAYSLHAPIVETYQTINPAIWYSTHPSGSSSPQNGWFYENLLREGFTLSGGSFNEPNNRWIYFIDADPACGQYLGGTSGIATLAANDLRGLSGGQNIPACSTESPDRSGKYRWIGGLGHELGHAFNLPHPPGCDQGNCTGGTNAFNSLMYVGYALYPNTYFLAEDKQSLLSSGFYTPQDLRQPQMFDFGNDWKADFSIWRPAIGVWSILSGADGMQTHIQWGTAGDKIVPGDFDGDGKTDTAVWRPNEGVWYILRSSTNVLYAEQFGINGDIPIAADYDGDRLTDIAVWRPANGTWYIKRSASNTVLYFQFGSSQDKPVPADYNGDKRTDIAVFRPSSSNWFVYNNYFSYFYAASQVNLTVTTFGSASDKLLPADYDGDKKADIAVWRPDNGTWYFQGSSSGSKQVQWGTAGDFPTPADYDNDGKVDFAVWRPGNGAFYILQSSNGNLQAAQWGTNGDQPAANSIVR